MTGRRKQSDRRGADRTGLSPDPSPGANASSRWGQSRLAVLVFDDGSEVLLELDEAAQLAVKTPLERP